MKCMLRKQTNASGMSSIFSTPVSAVKNSGNCSATGDNVQLHTSREYQVPPKPLELRP